MHVARYLTPTLQKSKKSVLLLGPRQTGKSTLIRELRPELEINLADQEIFVQYLRDPGLLKKVLGNNKTIFIDEIQRIPSLLNTVQFVLDKAPKDQALKFYLSGSSARKLKRGQANLLPGRIFAFTLGPLSPSELGDQFEIERALKQGLLPEAYLESDSFSWQKLLKSYAATYLKEEVQAEALTRNLEGFSRFFDVVTSRSGDFIDFTKFSSQALIERTSAKRYFEILCDTLIVEPVEAFAKSGKRRLIQHPKFYFFDVGVLNGVLQNFECSADRVGALFENLFLQCLLSEFKSRDLDSRLSVYRTEAGAEVDFIIERGKEVFAVEVKSSKNIGVTDLRGLRSFKEYYGRTCHPMIVYRGDRKLMVDGIPAYPLVEAMKVIVSA